MTVTKRLVISGRVQGVGFRFYIEHKARQHGICGWVRNRRDGTVEAMIQAGADAVEAMIRSAQSGPRGSVVTHLQITEGSGEYTTFEVRPTE